ncbi:hypothetical protein [Nonomuraea rubra]|uniref:hypothetical protein n=1 Tax=Nonomuraea rubra TaxID=46180 RepID=UPI0031EAE719
MLEQARALAAGATAWSSSPTWTTARRRCSCGLRGVRAAHQARARLRRDVRHRAGREDAGRGGPIVTTPTGGTLEAVGDTAVIVPPGDAAALAQAVDRVVMELSAGERHDLEVRARTRAMAFDPGRGVRRAVPRRNRPRSRRLTGRAGAGRGACGRLRWISRAGRARR